MNDTTDTGGGRWHVDPTTLTRYAHGAVGDVTTRASVEAHVVACRSCASSLAEHAGIDADAEWRSIDERLDRTSLFGTGRPALWWTALVTPRLFGATALLAALVLLGAAVVGNDRRGGMSIVVIALGPIAPAALAALAYTPWIDPVGVVAWASPLADRLPFVRALVASLAASACAVVASPLTGLRLGELAALALPALAVDAVVIAAARWVDPWKPAFALAGVWAAIVADATGWTGFRRVQFADLLTTTAAAQVGCLIVAALATAVVLHGWQHDEYGARG